MHWINNYSFLLMEVLLAHQGPYCSLLSALSPYCCSAVDKFHALHWASPPLLMISPSFLLWGQSTTVQIHRQGTGAGFCC